MEREPDINKLFRMVRKHGASDLYLDVGSEPSVRLAGVIRKMVALPLSQEVLERLLLPLLYPEQQQRLDQGEDVAFMYCFEEGDLYHVSVSKKGGQFKLSAHWLKVA
jgi:Tfp pilus assembly pilus retraction ATPase PilT